MNSPGQGNTLCGEVVQNLGKGIFIFHFRADVFIAGNRPFCPSRGRFGIIRTFHTGQVQSAAETVFPGLEGMGMIGHGTPDPGQITILVPFCQWLHFGKMPVGLRPQLLNKSRSIRCGTFFSDDDE